MLFDVTLIGSAADALGHTMTFTRNGVSAAPSFKSFLRIWAVSDMHVKASDGSIDKPIQKFNRAIADANGIGCDLAMINGDLTHYGYANEYAQVGSCLANLDMPYEATTGNHEFLGRESEATQKQRFMAQFGYTGTLYGHHIRNGIMLVRVCTEIANANAGYLRSAQLNWLSNLLAANPDKTTLIFMHHPLQNTVAKSEIFPGFMEQSPQVRSILSANPQVKLVVSGHTHQQMTDTPQWMTDSSGVQVAGGSSTAYRREYTEESTLETSRKTYTMEQSPFVEVYPDRISLRGRRHEAGLQDWLTEHTLTTPTTYQQPMVIAPAGEVLRYQVDTPSIFTFAGKYMPRFNSATSRSTPATILHVRDGCGTAIRTLEFRPDQRVFRFTDGLTPLDSTAQSFKTSQPVYFAVQQSTAGQRLYLRVGDRGEIQVFGNTQAHLQVGLAELFLGNTPDGATGMDGWCALRLWSDTLDQAEIVSEWAQMERL